ncbi:concanavalin A-like lectin/glucanase domain-containing protein [Mycotypha africana]|uniref:concanavalin A-like lectin/glucanase domain-containing protein n=1 Tax=Mycotypha africana TaxID=64632 RepID=UPI0023001105|nr:concanavalin A-like lectin/glucanase domain-containing protein [Mycotypha africana]KAI8979852.1 concanavalin A-like lectin/glucanase domain-containing protein [Mycotypha africana]
MDTATRSTSTNRQRRGPNRRDRASFYMRERNMMHALDTLFGLAHTGTGYIAFVRTIVMSMQYDNPVAMAFLCHVIDKSALPSKDTLQKIGPLVLSLLNKKPSRLRRMVSLITKRCGMERGANNRELLRMQLFDDNATSATLMASDQDPQSLLHKINGAIVLSLLAEKFAGEMCLMLWSEDIGKMLMKSLVDTQEDLTARLFALIALEKFALTGAVKSALLSHEMPLRSALLDILMECEHAYKRIRRRAVGFTDGDSIPPKGPLREEWAKYMQLEMSCRWALDRVFIEKNVLSSPWNISQLGVIMNPFDATPYMKVGMHGLTLRNDRPQFESVRATACVKDGKWYYETLVLTNGIMQIGWATNRCRFSPDDGYGVGDDRNGFAFDTYRTAIWADGSAVYPQMEYRARCEAGDVVGSFLDLDNGFCSFYINGKNHGLTVEFDHPNKRIDTLSPRSREIALKKKAVGLGLYPAVSLTTNQHCMINFGDCPWLYPPPLTVEFQGVNKAGKLDDDFIRRVLRWEKKRGVTTHGKSYKPMNKPPLRPLEGADETPVRSPLSATSDEENGISDNEDKYDWDGPLCTMCFSEPKNAMLLPCKHTGFGVQCAKIFKNW